MRIAVFTDTYYPNVDGVVVSVDNSTRLLSERHKILIFAPEYKGFKDVNKGNIRVLRLFSVKCPSYDTFRIAFPNILKCNNLIKRFKPDIIHVHTPGLVGVAGLICAKRNSIPAIATYHTLASETLTYLSPYRLMRIDAVVDAIKKKGMSRMLKTFRTGRVKQVSETFPKKIVWKAMIMFHNHFNLVTAPSESIAHELKRHGLKTRVTVLSNGLDLKRFKPKKNYKSSSPRILYVGRLGYEKNIEILLRAMKLVLKNSPKAALTIVGQGPAMESLKRLASELGMQRSVKFTGFVKNEKLPKIYQSHDVFVTASTFETQGIVIIEAMASGLPVVGVNKYAVPDIVKHGKNGFVAEPGDYEEIARFIIKLIEHERLRHTMGKRSVELSREHELSRVVKKMEDVYFNFSCNRPIQA